MCAKESFPRFYELPSESLCSKTTKVLQMSKIWSHSKKSVRRRGDVLGVGVTMSTESAEQGYSQDDVTVERIVWRMQDVKL